MGEIRFLVEVLVGDDWVPAHRILHDFPDEVSAIKVALKLYPITCFIQKHQGPVGIRVVSVVAEAVHSSAH